MMRHYIRRAACLSGNCIGRNICNVITLQNYWLRRSASEAVGRGVSSRSSAVVTAVVRHLKDTHRHVRRQAAISLGQLGSAAT